MFAGQCGATGAIRITVRLRAAYSTICQFRTSTAGATATAPNASQTSKDTSAPVSSTNGTKGSPGRPAVSFRSGRSWRPFGTPRRSLADQQAGI
jgi:hypothetical protein